MFGAMDIWYAGKGVCCMEGVDVGVGFVLGRVKGMWCGEWSV